jgi:hypothetical protein
MSRGKRTSALGCVNFGHTLYVYAIYCAVQSYLTWCARVRVVGDDQWDKKDLSKMRQNSRLDFVHDDVYILHKRDNITIPSNQSSK